MPKIEISISLFVRHEWDKPAGEQGNEPRLHIKKADVQLMGIDCDGWVCDNPSRGCYTDFYTRYHMIAGDLFGKKGDHGLGGMSIHDFDDNSFIGKIKLGSSLSLGKLN